MTVPHPATDGLTATVRALQNGRHALFVVLLVVTTWRALAAGAPPVAAVPAVLGLLTWYAVGVTLARRAARAAGGWWLLGLTALAHAALVAWAQALVGDRSAVAPVAATFLVALAFHPAYVRVQPVAPKNPLVPAHAPAALWSAKVAS